ncbi:MAG: hypothetical protein ACRDLT_10700 [Solirubrobacteraceae bacterium]
MSRRLPQIVFGLLALATIAAFFLVQTLKTEAPVFWTTPSPIPAAFNPVFGRPCTSRKGVPLNYRHTALTLSVTRTDTVGVYIVNAKDPNGNTVATVSAGTPMLAAAKAGQNPKTFTWNGRLADGQIAPNGTTYYFRIVLEQEDHSVNLSTRPVRVMTQAPHPKIVSVGLLGSDTASSTDTTATGTATATAGATTATAGATTGTAGATTPTAGATTGTSTGAAAKRGHGAVLLPGPAVLSPPHGEVRITFTPGVYRRVWIHIYRTDVAGGPELVDTVPVTRVGRDWTTWNGTIDGQPAPAGTYLVGIKAQDMACNKAQWPALPPVAGATAHAGVTVRYLSVTPPLTPIVSGGRASVAVNSAGAAFSWRLRRPGSAKLLAHGSGGVGASVIHVPMPRHRAGLYTLTVRADSQSAVVPLVASQAGAVAAHARVLVVLPMLTWMGNTPVDDSGDGLPDTLRAGNTVSLARPLVDGSPAGFGADATLLAYLTAHHLSYQLTTDVALAEGSGPSLADRRGVIFPGGEDFLPAGLELTLRGFVRGGGRVLALGTGAFSGISHISGFPAAPRAAAPRLVTTDLFGASHGRVTPTNGELISSVSADAFGLFGDAGEFGGFGQYQPISPPTSAASGAVSAVGIGSAAPAIVAFPYGSGTVVEVGLSGFAASLARNADSDSLLDNVWQLLSQ